MRHSGFPPLTPALALALFAAGLALPALAQSFAVPPLSAALGSEISTSITFHFSAPTVVGAISVVTQGLTDLDFRRDASAPGTCVPAAYPTGAQCTVSVDFTPAAPGPVAGAVVLFGGSGIPLQTAFLRGVGAGSARALDQAPGSSRITVLVAPGPYAPVQTMLDAAGDLFLADSASNAIVEMRPAGSNRTITAAGANPDFTAIQGEALDGAGNLYALYTDAVYQFPDQNGAYGSGRLIYAAPNGDVLTGIAADGAGNLYVADSNAGLFQLAAGTWTSTRVGNSVLPGGAALVAADAAGDVWTSDSACNIYKLLPTGGNTLLAAGTSACITGLAVDAAGDLLLTRGAAEGSVTTVPANGGPPATVAIESEGYSAGAPAFDRQGNAYFVSEDPNHGYTVEEVPSSAVAISAAASSQVSLSTSSLTFGLEAVGASSAPQDVIVTNSGGIALTGLTISSPAAFPISSDRCGNFLAPGGSCTLAVAFAPRAGGEQSGMLTVSAGGGTFATDALAGTGSDFTLAAGPVPVIAAGKSAVIALSLASVAGDTQTVALTCAVAAAGAGCSVAPRTVPLSGSASASALLTVTTAASTAWAPPRSPPRWPWAGLGAALLLAAVVLLRARRRALHCWKLAWVAGAVALCAACGGGASHRGAISSSSKSPPVTAIMTVTVRAVSSTGVAHTLQVPMSVTSD